jgi:hypothetical protein
VNEYLTLSEALGKAHVLVHKVQQSRSLLPGLWEQLRMSVALCTNANGSEKLEPFFIGHYLKPRAFQKKSAEQLGLYYRASCKAWMTALLFQEWLLKFDRKMRLANHQVLLLLDNAPTHSIKGIELSNVNGVFPPSEYYISPSADGSRNYRCFQEKVPFLSVGPGFEHGCSR